MAAGRSRPEAPRWPGHYQRPARRPQPQPGREPRPRQRPSWRDREGGPMRIPLTFVIFRVTATTITVLVLLAVVLGLTGRGPLDALSGVTHHAAGWLRVNTG